MLLFLSTSFLSKFHRRINAPNLNNCFMKQFFQLHTFIGMHRKIILAILGTFCRKLPENHLRMLCEVAVQSITIRRNVQMNPVRLNVNRVVTLLKKNNIRHNLRTGICLECIIGQTDCAQQFCSLSNIPAGIGVFGIHCKTTGHKGNDTARTHLV